MSDDPKPRRGLLHRVPGWARPLLIVLLIALVGGIVYLRIADPVEAPSEGSAGSVLMSVFVIGIGLSSFWLAATLNPHKRKRMQNEGDFRVRAIAKLPLLAVRVIFTLAGIGITTLGVWALAT